MTKKSKKNRTKLKFIYFTVGFFILFALFYLFFLKTNSSDKTTNTADNNQYQYEVYKDVTIQTNKYVDTENQGFNKISLILGDNGDLETSNEETTIVATTANLKFSINDSTKTPFYKIDKHSSLLAIYEYTTNKSEGLEEEDKIRKYHAEFLIINDKGVVESLGISDKVFVSLKEDENGDLILKEKLYIDGYTHIPSWDRPHVLYTSKFENGTFNLVDKKEVYEF